MLYNRFMSKIVSPETPSDILSALSVDRSTHMEAMWYVPLDGSGFGEYDPEYPMRGHGAYTLGSTVEGSAASVISGSYGAFETGRVNDQTVASFGLNTRTRRYSSKFEPVHFWFAMPDVELSELGPNYDSLVVAAHGIHHYVNGFNDKESVEIERQVELVRQQESADSDTASRILWKLAEMEYAGRLGLRKPDGSFDIPEEVLAELKNA